ncbi:hypothetical protein TNCV_3454961 [Trichonephila clavipes]|nr:hypothetical protein TNCV_3454961 [Trichonephila clavipes]
MLDQRIAACLPPPTYLNFGGHCLMSSVIFPKRSFFSIFSAPEIQFFLAAAFASSLPFINQRVGSFFFLASILWPRCQEASIFERLPSGPPTEDRSNAPTHEALDNAYHHIRDFEKQVALSEGKLQESQRSIIAKPSYAQVASSPAAVSSFTIPPPPSEKKRPSGSDFEPNADSSTTRVTK